MNKRLLVAGAAILVLLAIVVIGLNVWPLLSDLRTGRSHAAAPPVAAAQTATPFLNDGEKGGDATALRAAAAKQPGDAGGWVKLGNAYLSQNAFPSAIDAYRRALAIDPNMGGVWSTLGEAYIHSEPSSGRNIPPHAQAAFDKALALDGNDLRAHFYLAMQKDFNGQHDEALGEWMSMLTVVPKGSQPDKAIRAAITASVQRYLIAIKRALDDATRAQAAVRPVPVPTHR